MALFPGSGGNAPYREQDLKYKLYKMMLDPWKVSFCASGLDIADQGYSLIQLTNYKALQGTAYNARSSMNNRSRGRGRGGRDSYGSLVAWLAADASMTVVIIPLLNVLAGARVLEEAAALLQPILPTDPVGVNMKLVIRLDVLRTIQARVLLFSLQALVVLPLVVVVALATMDVVAAVVVLEDVATGEVFLLVVKLTLQKPPLL